MSMPQAPANLLAGLSRRSLCRAVFQSSLSVVNTLARRLDYFKGMSDSLDRLYVAVLAAKDLDPAVSRTARLFQRGPDKMAKKLAEEAIEVVIDAVNGKTRPSSARAQTFSTISPCSGPPPAFARKTCGRKWSGASICSGSPRRCRSHRSRLRRPAWRGGRLSRLKAGPYASATRSQKP